YESSPNEYILSQSCFISSISCEIYIIMSCLSITNSFRYVAISFLDLKSIPTVGSSNNNNSGSSTNEIAKFTFRFMPPDNVETFSVHFIKFISVHTFLKSSSDCLFQDNCSKNIMFSRTDKCSQTAIS